LFEPTCNAARCTSTFAPTSTLFTGCKRDRWVTQTDASMHGVKDKRTLSHSLNVTAGRMGLPESHQWKITAGIPKSLNPCPTAICDLCSPRGTFVCIHTHWRLNDETYTRPIRPRMVANNKLPHTMTYTFTPALQLISYLTSPTPPRQTRVLHLYHAIHATLITIK
jgi:hypothetical protein